MSAIGKKAAFAFFDGGLVMDIDFDSSRPYGLELTNNSKTGWAFSLSRSMSCVHATDVCRKLCYGRGIRYQSKGAKAKRERNFRTVEYLLNLPGVNNIELLSEALLSLIDHARPVDFLSAKYTGRRTALPWTIRIHDVGDFHRPEYISAWSRAVSKRPDCTFWFYTRSFLSTPMCVAFRSLVSQPNCQGWLSIDQDNYLFGLDVYQSNPDWKVALLQEGAEVMPSDLLAALSATVATKDLINFPYHHGGRHILPITAPSVVVCPQVTGVYQLEANQRLPRPCQLCSFCLP
jgi:hypothetical protein